MSALDKRARAHLLSQLEAGLRNIELIGGKFPKIGSFKAIASLEKSFDSDKADELRQLIDDNFLRDFVFGELCNLFLGSDIPWNDDPTNLADCELIDVPVLAAQLMSKLEGLPNRYRFSIKLPGEFGSIMEEGKFFELDSETRIADAGYLFDLPRSSGSVGLDQSIHDFGLLHTGDMGQWDGTYFITDVAGWVGTFTDSEARRVAERRLKTFLGLAVAMGLLEVRHGSKGQGNSRFLIHRISDPDSPIMEAHVLPKQMDNAFANLVLTQKLPGHDTRLKTVLIILRLLEPVFRGGDQAARIELAAQWFFDAETNDQSLLGFVQSMVCLEILFGDKQAAQKLGLNELLKNRCAYAIGQSLTDRNAVMDSFDEIYDVRSRIVHTGHSRLSTYERKLLQRLRNYCRRAIFSEVEMLEKALDQNVFS